MSTLLIGLAAEPPKQSDPIDKVRSTVTTVTDDAPSVSTSTPEQGRLETDAHTDGGLTPHAVASRVIPSERYVPATESRGDHMNAVNARISSSGTAAGREASGQWGHGTAYAQDAITRPVDAPFSETYFKRDERGANAPAGAYMTPAVAADDETLNQVQQVGKARIRDRESENPYNTMYRNMMNGVQ